MFKNIDKNIIISGVLIALFCGIVGFYSGRYYETTQNRKRFASFRNNPNGMMQRRQGGNNNFGPNRQQALPVPTTIPQGSAPTTK